MADIVLLVVTDSGVAQGIERAFRMHGVDAVIADEAESALVALDFEKPVAVVLENDLPDRTGAQLAEQFRKRPEGEFCPIILLAGPMMTAAELAPKALDSGVTACLDADVDRTALAYAVIAMINQDSGPMQRLVNGESEGSVTVIDEAVASAAALGDDDGEVTHRDPEDGAAPAAPPKKGGIDVEVEATPPPPEEPKKPAPPPEPPKPPAQPRSGTLTSQPFGRLLAELRRDFATGVLDLSREKVKKSLWLRDGVPVFAKSNAMGETLGAVLVKMGRITEEQRVKSMEVTQKAKRKHGDVLVEMGFIKPKDVGTALQAQARAKVINCFAWDDGSYAFKPTAELPDDLPELKMSFGALIAAGVKQRYDMPRLRKAILPHISETPRFLEAGAGILDEMKVDDDERTVLESLAGKRSLAEVLALSDMDERQLHRILVTAYFAGVVRFAPEGPATKRLRIQKEEESKDHLIPSGPPPPLKKRDPEPEKKKPEPINILLDMDDDADDAGAETNRGAAAEYESTRPPLVDPAVEGKIDAALSKLSGKNFYERLAVPTDADDPAIKSSYLRLAKEYHPDRLVSEGGSGIKDKADRLFVMISDAYQTLSDSAKRRKYDDEVLHGKKSDEDASDEANAILNAESQFLKGERLLKAGNLAKAFEAFKEAVSLYPKESEYQAFYGWTMFKLNHPAEAAKAAEGEKIVREALKTNARNDKAHYFLGQVAKLKGDEDDAKTHFEKALAIQPDNIDAQRELRLMEARDGKKGIGGLFRKK